MTKKMFRLKPNLKLFLFLSILFLFFTLSYGNILITKFTNYINYNNSNSNFPKVSSSTRITTEWSATSGYENMDIVSRCAIDSFNNIYFCGIINDGSGNEDILLVKFNHKGEQEWNRTWGGNEDDDGFGININNPNEIYVSGITRSFGDIDGDAVLIQYNSTGHQQWNLTWGGDEFEIGTTIDIDSLGNIYLGGKTNDNDTMGDTFIVKFNSSRQEEWNITYGNFGMVETLTALKIDENNYIYAVISSETDAPINETRIVTFKYNSSGGLVWKEVWGFGKSNEVYDLDFDSSKNVYLVGYYTISSNFYGFMVKYDQNGYRQWNISFVTGEISVNAWTEMTIDMNDEIYVAGTTITHGISSGLDGIIFNYDINGNLNWYKAWGDTGDDSFMDVICDSENNLYVIGYTNSFGALSDDFLIIKYNIIFPDKTPPAISFPWIIIIIIIILSMVGVLIPSTYIIISKHKKKREEIDKALVKKKSPKRKLQSKDIVNFEQKRQQKPHILPEIFSPIKTSDSEIFSKATIPKKAKKIKKIEPEIIDITHDQKIIDETNKTESEMEIKNELDRCIIHKGHIKGLSYVCPKCYSKYCINCAQSIIERQEVCWVCETPITINQDRGIPIKAINDEFQSKHKIKDINIIQRLQEGGNLTTLSDNFWEDINKFKWEENEKEEFIKEMLSLTPKERQDILDLMLKEDSGKNELISK